MAPFAILILRTFPLMLELPLYTYCCLCIQNGYTKLFSLFKQFRDELSRHRVKSVYESWFSISIVVVFRIFLVQFRSWTSICHVKRIHGNKNIIKIEIIFAVSISIYIYIDFPFIHSTVSFYFVLFYFIYLFVFRECSFQFWLFLKKKKK